MAFVLVVCSFIGGTVGSLAVFRRRNSKKAGYAFAFLFHLVFLGLAATIWYQSSSEMRSFDIGAIKMLYMLSTIIPLSWFNAVIIQLTAGRQTKSRPLL